MTTLATSSGVPSRWSGTPAAMARPISSHISSSKLVFESHVLDFLRQLNSPASSRSSKTHRPIGAGIMPVPPIMAGATCRAVSLIGTTDLNCNCRGSRTMFTVTPSPATTAARLNPMELQQLLALPAAIRQTRTGFGRNENPKSSP